MSVKTGQAQTRQFDRVACVFGSELSSPTGEHVLPSWLLDLFPEADGPYTTWRGHKPIRKRDGEIRSQTSISRAKLPMCARHNQLLANRFEEPVRRFGRHLFGSDGDVRLSQNETAALGLWLVKRGCY
jgi:hypothetical protein